MIRFNKYKFILITSLLSLLYCSCTDIMDPDISGKEVVLLSPPDELLTILSTQTFWWEEMEFAEEYVLQIARPGFDYIEQIILDTVLTKNRFTFGLTPSEYEWRVQALNTRSETAFSTHSITIDTTMDITNEILQLQSPSSNDTTNKEEITFKWVKLYNAENYDFELEYDHSTILTRNTENDTVIVSIGENDGNYTWKVKAINTVAKTAWFQRNFFLDRDAPDTPVLTEPADNALLDDEKITFSWNRDLTDDSSIKDSLVIIKNLTTPEIKVAALLLETMYIDSLGPGSYTWYVRSVDKAGNLSNKSTERVLTIQ